MNPMVFVLTMAHIFRLTFLSVKPDHKFHPMTYRINGWEETVRKRSCTVSHSHYAITIYSFFYNIYVYIYIYLYIYIYVCYSFFSHDGVVFCVCFWGVAVFLKRSAPHRWKSPAQGRHCSGPAVRITKRTCRWDKGL